MTWQRLDLTMLEAGLVETRSHAARLIADGRVRVDGTLADKPARKVPAGAALEVVDAQLVGRGGYKLRGALNHFGLSVCDARCLDLGASTGGFTQQLLTAGAAHVVAVDVGHSQLDARLLADRRVSSHEGVNARYLEAGQFGEPFDIIVADLSFISLTLVASGLLAVAADDADLVLLVKPQFEVGKDHVGRTGLVTEPHLQAGAVDRVTSHFALLGWDLQQSVESPVMGGDGNREFFVWLRKRL